ncbi:MAG TPA: MarR family transcriptional regulator [Actinomycetales bacterium]|nr:MarR family transcriptional regulator [Actinomycetales bacterium]
MAQMHEAMQDFIAHAVLFQDAVARSVGLNSSDMQAVGLLMAKGPASPSDLAKMTGLTRGGAITGAIDRLERAGYVHRQPDPNDRRRVVVVADEEKVMSDVGPVYGRVAQKWTRYLRTLEDGQLAFATELFRRAAEINRVEVEDLQAESRPSRRPRSRRSE